MVYEVETVLILFAMNLYVQFKSVSTSMLDKEGRFSEKRSLVHSFVITT